jgi:hypothetical protein
MKPYRLAVPAIAALVWAGVLGQPAANASVHFATPLAAARYFATAVNDGDESALHQVTTPDAFKAAMGMRPQVKDVRVTSCPATGRGDYNCFLAFKYRDQRGTGQWDVIVAPATGPGWYVYRYPYHGCD